MTQAELYQELKKIGLPIAYNHFTNPPSLPYLIYLFSYSSDLIADNQNYLPISNFQVELYCDKKDLTNEKLVEDKFKELKMPYVKSETYIDTEKLYQIIYEIQLI